MPSLDVVIVVVYLFTLAYVGYQAWNNMEDRAAMVLDQAFLNQQLVEQGLDQAIALKIPLKPQYGFEPIADLSLTLVNTSSAPIYVDWDRCSLTNFSGRSRRVVRVTPSMNLDLSRPQVFSVVSPGNALTEKVIAEDMLKPGEGGALTIVAPLVDLKPLGGLPEDKRLEFALRLVLRRVTENPYHNEDDLNYHSITCRFSARRVPWDENFPWRKPKK